MQDRIIVLADCLNCFVGALHALGNADDGVESGPVRRGSRSNWWWSWSHHAERRLVASTVSFEEIPNGTREASYMNGTNTASLILGIL